MTGYKMKNKYLLVRPMDKHRKIDNGVTLTIEEQDRKVVTKGSIVASCSGNNEYCAGTIVVFPLYAADVIMDEDAGRLFIIKTDDVMMMEKE